VHQAPQEGPGGHDYAAAREVEIEVGTAAHHPALPVDQSGHGRLEQTQVRLQLQGVLQPELVHFLVTLGPGRLDRGALGLIEQAELNASQVGVDRHLAAQSIDLPHHLPLGLTADGRIAAHLGHGVQISGQQQGRRPHPRRGQRGLHARVAGAAHDHVEGFVCSLHRG